MERVHLCFLCGGDNIKLRNLPFTQYGLAFCRGCSFVFISPRPSPDALEKAYLGFTNKTELLRLSPEGARKMSAPLHRLIKKYNVGAKRVLEIGCSSAYLLYGLKQYGYEVLGTDPSQEAAKLAQDYYGLRVEVADFPRNEPKDSFDVLILSHVIEHILEPADFLRQAAAFLKKGGLLILAAPNYQALGFKLFGDHYPVISPPFHLNFFSPKNLCLLLSDGDFEILSLKTQNADSFGRNPFFYNCFAALKSVFKRPGAQQAAGCQPNNQGNSEPSDLDFKRRLRKSFRMCLQVCFYPFFFSIDKIGWGENLLVVARKK